MRSDSRLPPLWRYRLRLSFFGCVLYIHGLIAQVFTAGLAVFANYEEASLPGGRDRQ